VLTDEVTGPADEDTGRVIGAWLRTEVADLGVPPDLIGTLRRRHSRRTAAVRGVIAAAGAAALATTAVTLAALSGPASPGQVSPSGALAARGTGNHPRADADSSGRSIELDGYEVRLPARLPVRRVGAGYVVGSHDTGYFTIFLERGKNLGPKLARAHGLTVHHVRVGIRSAWWVGTSHGGELWVQIPGLPATEYFVAKVLGAGEAAALSFARGLAVTHLPVVHVSCSASCG
jgi:hypothetical protein